MTNDAPRDVAANRSAARVKNRSVECMRDIAESNRHASRAATPDWNQARRAAKLRGTARKRTTCATKQTSGARAPPSRRIERSTLPMRDPHASTPHAVQRDAEAHRRSARSAGPAQADAQHATRDERNTTRRSRHDYGRTAESRHARAEGPPSEASDQSTSTCEYPDTNGLRVPSSR
ncbi:hypothetical protein WS71_05360 [Burkholderia mayonis]|uniref:Uncharacterized protein n=1 Tax=Burkholderia mayonis TaxID=1385591 RepID=A0A1B4FT10_9BURK|nr:hypothetical protein WS71_05360 [Burkholderia mayonis]KVE57672.1 hypothetical protein WS71_26460 [Burkholderia mayonis]